MQIILLTFGIFFTKFHNLVKYKNNFNNLHIEAFI